MSELVGKDRFSCIVAQILVVVYFREFNIPHLVFTGGSYEECY